jgi:transcriptional regulator with XRE-family HTH domain
VQIEKAFGISLQKLRSERLISQEQLAVMSGFHRTYISLLERGLKSPSLSTIHRLSKALEIPTHHLVLLAEETLIAAQDYSDETDS